MKQPCLCRLLAGSLLIAAVLSPVPGWAGSDIVLFSPHWFARVGAGWDATATGTLLSYAQDFYGVEGQVVMNLELDNSPPKLDDFSWPDASWLTLYCHGVDQWAALEHYAHPASCNSRITELKDAYGDGGGPYNYFSSAFIPDCGYCVYVSPLFISDHLRLQQGVLFEYRSCFSYNLLGAFGCLGGNNPGDGAAMGWLAEHYSDLEAYQNLQSGMATLACLHYSTPPPWSGPADNTAREAWEKVPSPNLQGIKVGWLDRRPAGTRDCKSWAADWDWAGAFDGTIYLGARNLQELSRCAVWGWNPGDGEKTLLGLFLWPGDGSDELHSYEFPCGGSDEWAYQSPSSFDSLEVVEQDNALRLTSTGAFGWSSVDPEFPVEAPEFHPTAGLSGEPLFRLDPASVRMENGHLTGDWLPVELGGDRDEGSPPAHMVIYCNNAQQSLGTMAYWHAEQEMANVVDGFKAAAYSGGPTVEDQRQAYEFVSLTNWMHNNHHEYQYPVAPDYYPVGRIIWIAEADSLWIGLQYEAVLDVDGGQCYTEWCRTRDLTDITGDGIPDGNTVWAPVWTDTQLLHATKAAEELNQGWSVDPDRGFALLLGNKLNGSGIVHPTFPRKFDDFRYGMEETGASYRGTLLEGDYPNVDAGAGAGTALINGGVATILFAGLETAPHDFTWFLRDPSTWTRRQRVLGIGISCGIGADNETWAHGATPLIGGDLSGTVFATVVGMLNAGWGIEHEAMLSYFLAEYAAAAIGTPIYWIVGDAKRAFAAAHPEWAKYANGLTAIGGIAKKIDSFDLPDDIPPVSVPEIPHRRFALSLDRNPAITSGGDEVSLAITLPGAGEVSLKVYDLMGRLVRQLSKGFYLAGEHRIRWDGTDRSGKKVSSGVYFFLLETPGASKTQKLVLLR